MKKNDYIRLIIAIILCPIILIGLGKTEYMLVFGITYLLVFNSYFWVKMTKKIESLKKYIDKK